MDMILIVGVSFNQLIILHILLKQLLNLSCMNHELIK